MKIDIDKIKQFKGDDLKYNIRYLESQLVSGNKSIKDFADHDLYRSAQEIKLLSNQIHEIIHSIGMINILDTILEPDEKIERISLGSGNSNSEFDLITNKRIAEFKFNLWNVGNNSNRKEEFLKDYLKLFIDNSNKKKEFYCFHKVEFEKYLTGNTKFKEIKKLTGKIISNVSDIETRYKLNLTTLRDLKNIPNHKVKIKDLNKYL